MRILAQRPWVSLGVRPEAGPATQPRVVVRTFMASRVCPLGEPGDAALGAAPGHSSLWPALFLFQATEETGSL